jgi:hypothetical protein
VVTALAELLAQGVRAVGRNGGFRMHAERGVQNFAPHRAMVERVDRFGDDRDARDVADRIRRTQYLVAPAHAAGAVLDRFGAQHQVREIDVPGMRRHVRALGHVAHVAEIAMVDHLAIGLLVHRREFAGRRLVDQVEQRRKRVAQIEAAAAAVTDVENPLELPIERGGVIELRILPVEGMARGRLETALAA